LVFKDESGIREIANQAALVDVAGASNEVYLKGCLLHLTANLIARIIKFRFDDISRQRSFSYEIIYIGETVLPPNINL
jgi:hypothetical protein